MNSKRVFFVMLGVVILIGLLIIGGTVYGNILLKQESKKLVDLKLQNRLLDEQQTSLIQANKDIEKYSELETTAKAIVPQDKDQAKAVRELVIIAEESGIKLNSISFPSSSLGQVQTVAPAANADNGETKAATPAAPPITQVKPVEGITGVYLMEINIQQDATVPVTYAQFIAFLERLEQNRRTAQVSNISITPDAQNRNLVAFNLTVNLYIKP